MELLTPSSHKKAKYPIDFDIVANAASRQMLNLIPQLLPDGQRVGAEWVALNPRRVDRNRGSFKVNLKTGKWADFATSVTGGNLISLIAYIKDVSKLDAAFILAEMLNLEAQQ